MSGKANSNQAVVAAVQLNSSADLADNLAQTATAIAAAAACGAELIVLPENFALMGANKEAMLQHTEQAGDGPLQSFISSQARKYQCYIVAGTLPLSCPDPERAYASCLLFDRQGEQLARYDKRHLFDADVGDHSAEKKRYRESDSWYPGEQLCVADTDLGKLGLSVCYDLRFPEQFRQMQQMGMELLAVPAAFTAATGKLHWRLLLQARAVENQCLVIGSAQVGQHADRRWTWGHSTIIDGWAEVLTELGAEPGVSTAVFDREQQQQLRKTFPVLKHRLD